MGFYINPPDKSKEDWLAEHGQVTITPAWPAPEGTVPVCLIDNGSFTAAGIAYCEAEFYAFAAPDSTPEEIAAMKQEVEATGTSFHSLDSGRQCPRTWYYVPIERIVKMEPRVAEFIS